MRASDSSAAQKANSSNPRSVFFLQSLALCFVFDFLCPFLTWSLTFCRSSSGSTRVTDFFSKTNHQINVQTTDSWKRSQSRSASNMHSYWWPAGGDSTDLPKKVRLLVFLTSVNSFLMISWPLSLVSSLHLYILMLSLYSLFPFRVKYTKKPSGRCYLVRDKLLPQLLCLSSGLHPSEEHLKANYITTPCEVCLSLKLLQRLLLLPVSGGRTATIPRALTYPKILCTFTFTGLGVRNGDVRVKHLVTQPGNAPKARPSHLTTADQVNEVSLKDSPSKTTEAESFRGRRAELRHSNCVQSQILHSSAPSSKYGHFWLQKPRWWQPDWGGVCAKLTKLSGFIWIPKQIFMSLIVLDTCQTHWTHRR